MVKPIEYKRSISVNSTLKKFPTKGEVEQIINNGTSPQRLELLNALKAEKRLAHVAEIGLADAGQNNNSLNERRKLSLVSYLVDTITELVVATQKPLSQIPFSVQPQESLGENKYIKWDTYGQSEPYDALRHEERHVSVAFQTNLSNFDEMLLGAYDIAADRAIYPITGLDRKIFFRGPLSLEELNERSSGFSTEVLKIIFPDEVNIKLPDWERPSVIKFNELKQKLLESVNANDSEAAEIARQEINTLIGKCNIEDFNNTINKFKAHVENLLTDENKNYSIVSDYLNSLNGLTPKQFLFRYSDILNSSASYGKSNESFPISYRQDYSTSRSRQVPAQRGENNKNFLDKLIDQFTKLFTEDPNLLRSQTSSNRAFRSAILDTQSDHLGLVYSKCDLPSTVNSVIDVIDKTVAEHPSNIILDSPESAKLTSLERWIESDRLSRQQ